MPDELQALRDRIEVLEFELAEALRVDAIAPLQVRYGLRRQWAAVLAYMLDGQIKTYDGTVIAIGRAIDGGKNAVSVALSGLRRKLPWVKIVSVYGVGHYLAPESIGRIKADLAEQ